MTLFYKNKHFNILQKGHHGIKRWVTMRIPKIGLKGKTMMMMMMAAEKINRRMTTNIITKRVIRMKTTMMWTICMMNMAVGGTT